MDIPEFPDLKKETRMAVLAAPQTWAPPLLILVLLAAHRLTGQGLLGAGLSVPVPVRVDRQVPGHGEDPRPLPVLGHAGQLVQVLPDPQEHVLHQVGGRLPVAGPAGEVGVHRDAVRRVQAAELSFLVHRWPGCLRTRPS